MASTDDNVAVSREREINAEEDLIASEINLWLPRSVVKRHRKKATLIWISLLAAFFVYVGYVVWDTVDSRKNPAASIELKQSPFKFPDVAVCMTYLSGCMLESTNCIEGADFSLVEQRGFMEDPGEFDLADYPDVAKVREAFPSCAVMPLSQLTVNETGVENGDINSLSAKMFISWIDDPDGTLGVAEHHIFEQYVSAHFIDIGQDVDDIEGTVTSAKLPYERITLTTNETFISTSSHMVISMSEYSGITKNGDRKEHEKTYSQTTTTGKEHWYWTGDSYTSPIALLQLEVAITKFEFTRVKEVDPVDVWAIIGAIGGVWQFVVLAFGVFFIFSEKQRPDKKMRDFKETFVASAVKINKRLSSITTTSSSRPSQQDIEIDAGDDDLPPGWVKKQRRPGSVYYFHTMTGSTSVTPPNERGPTASAPAAPRPSNGARMLFRVAQDPQDSGTGGVQSSTNGTTDGGSLPPGWQQRTDADGRAYYVDTENQKTQWDPPSWRVSPRSGSRVQTVDAPLRRVRRSSATDIPPPTAPPAIIPPTTAVRRNVVDDPLPPNWEIRTSPNGKTYYANTVTKKTQWTIPVIPV